VEQAGSAWLNKLEIKDAPLHLAAQPRMHIIAKSLYLSKCLGCNGLSVYEIGCQSLFPTFDSALV